MAIDRNGPTTLRDLVTQFAGSGRIEGIVLRAQRHGPAVWAEQVQAEPGRGLLGDHRAQRPIDLVAPRPAGDTADARTRELTLIQHEHLPLIGAWTGQGPIDARRLRRNLVISGLNLGAAHSPFADQSLVWRIGDEVLIEITGTCPPCSRMDRELGPGGYNALRHHGGMTARLLSAGTIRVGDALCLERVDIGPRA